MTALSDIDVVILAGGLGTRLSGVVSDRPKVLAPVLDRPYLEILLDWVAGFGARRIILSIGFKADQVAAFASAYNRPGISLQTVIEEAPLGTAGAITNSRAKIQSDTVLVMNGDSFVDADLAEFADSHRTSSSMASLLCTRVPDASRYGAVEVNDDGRIVEFREKNQTGQAGHINAGVYLFEPAMLETVATATGPSLERDVFQVLPAGTLHAYTGEFTFLDIGTPQDYARAPEILSPYMNDRSRVTA